MYTAQDLVHYWEKTAHLGLGLITGSSSGILGNLRASGDEADLPEEQPYIRNDLMRGAAYGLAGDLGGAYAGALLGNALNLEEGPYQAAMLAGSLLGQGYGGYKNYRRAYEAALERKEARAAKVEEKLARSAAAKRGAETRAARIK